MGPITSGRREIPSVVRLSRERRAQLIEQGAVVRTLRMSTVELMHGVPGERLSGAGWIWELKYDGYRMLAGLGEGRPHLQYRRGSDATPSWPEIAHALEGLGLEDVILDGEVVVFDTSGRPSFGLVQERFGIRKPTAVAHAMVKTPGALFAFDVLGIDDLDLRPLPLLTRKALLEEILRGRDMGPLRYVDHVLDDGERLFAEARARDAEGVVAKRAASKYVGGRSGDWIKVRANLTSDFVVVGYSTGALHLAAFVGSHLAYCGRVRAGFPRGVLDDIGRALQEIRVPDPPCVGVPSTEADYWAEPHVVCEVGYLEITADGVLRHPMFVRFRNDKAAEECVMPPGGGTGVEDRPLYRRRRWW